MGWSSTHLVSLPHYLLRYSVTKKVDAVLMSYNNTTSAVVDLSINIQSTIRDFHNIFTDEVKVSKPVL